MKYFLFLILLLPQATHSLKPSDLRINIDFDGKVIQINDMTFNENSTLNDYVKVLGDFDRVEKGINNIFLFDQYGLILLENPKTKFIEEFSIQFVEAEGKRATKSIFKGTLQINGMGIKPTESMSQIKEKTKEIEYTDIRNQWFMANSDKFGIVIMYEQIDKQIKLFTASFKASPMMK